jgi:F-type H+-transporting ATPase subunit alpha
VLYALTRGLLDDIALDKIKAFEEGLVEYAQSHAKKFMKEVIEKGMWSDDGEAELKKMIEECKGVFEK